VVKRHLLLKRYFSYYYVTSRGAGSGWAGWTIAHLDFAVIERETKIDNILLFSHPEFTGLQQLCQ
jgi:hypothetical protein